jgi:UTP-glucose-1-phosphate uridylyltransferase
LQTKKNKPVLVILAAGLGSRFGGGKQIAALPLLDCTIMELSIQDAYLAGMRTVILVINDAVRDTIERAILPRLPSDLEVELVHQSIDDVPAKFAHCIAMRNKPWGTGHALLSAKSHIQGPAIVITADDYYGPQAHIQLMAHFQQNQDEMAMVAYPLKNTLSDQGGVNRGICQLKNDKLEHVVEYTNIYQSEAGIVGTYNGKTHGLSDLALASMTFWGITPAFLTDLEKGFYEFLEGYDNDVKKEYYLPNCVEQSIVSSGLKVAVYSARDHWFGVTYKEELLAVARKIHEQRKQ